MGRIQEHKLPQMESGIAVEMHAWFTSVLNTSFIGYHRINYLAYVGREVAA